MCTQLVILDDRDIFTMYGSFHTGLQKCPGALTARSPAPPPTPPGPVSAIELEGTGRMGGYWPVLCVRLCESQQMLALVAVFRGLHSVAKRFYLLFQHHTTESLAEQNRDFVNSM